VFNFVLRIFFVVENVALLFSVASDVNPDQVAEPRTAELATAIEDAAPWATEQPAAAAAATVAEGQSAPASTTASTPSGGEEAARTPPPSTVAEEEGRVPTPPVGEGKVPTPPRAGASSPVGSPCLDQGPVMPTTAAGGSAADEEPQAPSDDDVEEVQGHPRDGRQHVYVWRQRRDHFIGHEELAETEEAARVERATKRLVDEVKVGGLCIAQQVYVVLLCSTYVFPCRAR